MSNPPNTPNADENHPSSEEEDICPICYEVIQDLALTSCGHRFCRSDLLRALIINTRCPYCRTELLVQEEQAMDGVEIRDSDSEFYDSADTVNRVGRRVSEDDTSSDHSADSANAGDTQEPEDEDGGGSDHSEGREDLESSDTERLDSEEEEET